MHIRPATVADLDLLRRWDEQPHVVAADPKDDWGWEVELNKKPDWREQLIAEVDGRPVGFIQIIDPAREESHYWGDVPTNLCAVDLWIGDELNLGKGYGTAMMHLALARCFAAPDVAAVLVDPLASNTRAHRFYERLGFRIVERRHFGEDECLVYRLERSDYHPLDPDGSNLYTGVSDRLWTPLLGCTGLQMELVCFGHGVRDRWRDHEYRNLRDGEGNQRVGPASPDLRKGTVEEAEGDCESPIARWSRATRRATLI